MNEKENVAHIYNGLLLSHKKEWNNAICSDMDGPGDCHTEWRESDKDKYITDMWDLKKKKSDTNELICKTEIVTEVENKFMVTKEGMKGVG